jgi:hypothetical protein
MVVLLGLVAREAFVVVTSSCRFVIGHIVGWVYAIEFFI